MQNKNMAAYKKNKEKLLTYLEKREKEKKDANIKSGNKVTK